MPHPPESSPASEFDWQPFLNEMIALRQVINQQVLVQEELRLHITTQQQTTQNLATALQSLTNATEQKIPNYTPLLRELKQTSENIYQEQEQLRKIVVQNSPSTYLPSIEHSLSAFDKRLGRLEQSIESQQRTVNTQFDWKVLATNLLTSSVVIAVTVTLAIRLFPPSADPSLTKKLAGMNQHIEQIRKQTRR
jgi:hypothetical protein